MRPLRRLRAAFLVLLACLWRAPSAAPATFFVSPTGSDSDPGTQAQPFQTVQRGLDAASPGDTVLVTTGTYAVTSALVMSTPSVALEGSSWQGSVLDGQGTWGGGSEGNTAVIWVATGTTGVAIRRLTIANRFHGVFLEDGAVAVVEGNRIASNFLNGVTFKASASTIRYNLFLGRSGFSPVLWSYTGIDGWSPAAPVLHNNTIVDAQFIGICTLGGASPVILNNLIVDSGQGIGSPDGTGSPVIQYNDVWSNAQNFDSYIKNRAGKDGNIAADPVFVDAASGDYRLRSCSPAVDAGHPGGAYQDPDGTRNDMGAFPLTGGRLALKPPKQLTAVAVPGAKVELRWLGSASPEAVEYHLYYTTAEALAYVAPQAVLPRDQLAYTTPRLAPGLLYRFGLRASDGVCEEANDTVLAFATPFDDPFPLRAVIKVPKSGHKVGGNRVNVVAELASGSPSQVQGILFQSRAAEPDEPPQPWSDIPPATAQHPNPDADAPYFVHWDVTGLPGGTYQLRAVAYDLLGTPDPAPPAITIRIDNADPDEQGTAGALGLEHTEKVDNGGLNLVTLGDLSGTLTQVALPAGSLSASSTTLTIVADPSGIPVLSGPRGTLLDLARYQDVSLGAGQLVGAALITLAYPDADGDGLVDGARISPLNLELRWLDLSVPAWVRVSRASSADPSGRTASFWTPHFSAFGLFAPAASDLSALEVYPVPWVPNDGQDDNGRPFSASDPDSGIIFNALTDGVRIEVYSVTGQLVWRRETALSGQRVQWDARTLDGRDAASGVYFAVVTDPLTKEKVVRKLAIIR